VCADLSTKTFEVTDYDLSTTLESGQAFGWRKHGQGWVGVVDRRWVFLESSATTLRAETAGEVRDWSWLIHYLQLELDLGSIVATFPADPPMQQAVRACRGLRLLRQDPWETLASFILSSTKQITQIQQIVRLVCERFGAGVPTPPGHTPAYAFPAAEVLADLGEKQLRDCKMGFRAPYLLGAARAVAQGRLDLNALESMPTEAARTQLSALHGVGRKISDCVLLFAYGRQDAFPVDVWIMKMLREQYFPRRKVNLRRLQRFAATHFGPNAGYAQQYLFHYARSQISQRARDAS